MNILITGATGFIGCHLVRKLATTHRIFGLMRSEQSDMFSGVCINPVIADLSNPTFSQNLPADIDCVIHLAQSTEYRNFPTSAEDMRRINIDSTAQLLEWARKTNVQQFMYSSTANVYGTTSDVLTESHPTNPDSFYGATKLSAEYLTKQYQEYFQVTILRLFTVYGADQKDMLIPNIIKRISTGKPITLAEKAGIYLSPIYVSDVVEIIHKLVAIPSNQHSRLMNICGDQVVSLKEIVLILERLTGRVAKIQITDDDALHFIGANNELKSFIPGINFVEIHNGLSDTVK